MIFSENYDRSLWLMLAGDHNNRYKIAQCLKSLPDYIRNDIILFIEETKNNSDELVRQYYVYGHQILIGISNSVLNIGYYSVLPEDEMEHHSDFEISLANISVDMLENREKNGNLYIGYFMHLAKHGEVCKCCGEGFVYVDKIVKEKYELLARSSVVEHTYDNISYVTPMWNSRVNLKNMPKNMYIHQLDNPKRINRLVRKK